MRKSCGLTYGLPGDLPPCSEPATAERAWWDPGTPQAAGPRPGVAEVPCCRWPALPRQAGPRSAFLHSPAWPFLSAAGTCRSGPPTPFSGLPDSGQRRLQGRLVAGGVCGGCRLAALALCLQPGLWALRPVDARLWRSALPPHPLPTPSWRKQALLGSQHGNWQLLGVWASALPRPHEAVTEPPTEPGAGPRWAQLSWAAPLSGLSGPPQSLQRV